MRILLNEQQYSKLPEREIEEVYPPSWSLDEFKSISSYAGRLKYAATHLKRISSGSSRVVYMVDNEKVLKIAKNRKGLAQNETEISFGNDYVFADILANVYDSDEDNNIWVEMELAKAGGSGRFPPEV